MLVLSRKSGERVFIGDEIEVVVVEVRGDRVKFGFRAPRSLLIRRGELDRHTEGGVPALEHAECA